MVSFIQTIRRRAERDIQLVESIKEVFKEKRIILPIEADQWIRVSSLGAVCQREEVLCSLHNIEREDEIEGISGVNFEHGHAVHWMFQNKVLPKVGVIIGSWRCTYCGTQYGSRAEGYVPRPERCVRCGAIAGERARTDGRPDLETSDNAFIFVEEWIGNYKYKIGGSPDGHLIADYYEGYKQSDLTVVECKSCNDNNYKKYVKSPDFVHVIQSQIYMWLTESPKAKIIYFNKNDNDMKEHDIDYDSECIELVLAAVEEIRNGIRNNIVPPRVVCAAPDCPRAFRCKVRDICFSE